VHGGDNEGKEIVERRYGHQRKIKKRSKDLRQNRSSSSVRPRKLIFYLVARDRASRLLASWISTDHFSLCLSKYTTSRASTYSCRNTLCINYKLDARKILFLQCKIISNKILYRYIQSVQWKILISIYLILFRTMFLGNYF